MKNHIKGSVALESELEKKTLAALRRHGILTYKFVSPTKRGVPDDIVLISDGLAVFVEFKSPRSGTKLTKLQVHQIEKIEGKGFPVFIVRSIATANEFIEWCIKEEQKNA
jgi:hypothetical protein